jgi:hypothetical protein
MRRVCLLSLGFARLCNASVAVTNDRSQNDEPRLEIGACAALISAPALFRHIEMLRALIPTLKEAKKAVGDRVQHPNILVSPVKMILCKASKPPA